MSDERWEPWEGEAREGWGHVKVRVREHEYVSAHDEVTFGADEEAESVLLRGLASDAQPALEAQERLARRQVEHGHQHVRAAVVRARDRPELLLASRVPAAHSTHARSLHDYYMFD